MERNVLSFTRQQSTFAKGIAILVMLIHHLYAFPDRFGYIFDYPYLVWLGQDCGIVVGLFVFLNGIGLTATRNDLIRLTGGGKKLMKIYVAFWKIAIPFLLIGFIFGYFEFDIHKIIANLSFWNSSYNHEWWYMNLYVKILLIGFFIYRIRCKWLLSLVTIATGLIAVYALHRYGYPFYGKLKLVGSVLRYWPVFVLALNVCLWNLFDRTDYVVEKVIPNKILRCSVYVTIAIAIHYMFPFEWSFLQYFFYYLAICFVRIGNTLSKAIMFLGKHSMNMWLIHTFICYYYWKDLFLAVSFNKWYLAFINLTILSLFASILINIIYNKAKHMLRNTYSHVIQ